MKSQLFIYCSLERKKKKFIPIQDPFVKIYCCGPTVYDYLHIGNFRGAIFYNFLRNWLKFLGYQVDFIYNFTDIDDKILNRSKKEGVDPQSISKKYIEEFKKDFKKLKLSPHTHNPKATETISEIQDLIKKLIELGKAYEVKGDVFYSVKSCKNYGRLSGRKIEDLSPGSRVEINKNKQDPLDFNLWKKSKPEENWFWESPWGKGRPGWHIECTAMIHKFLGSEIDIHGGGSDLIFPHHENEIAQSEACTNLTYVRYWVHNNMVITDSNKMSKSLGNIITMRDFLEKYPGEVFKYLILSTHYRSQVQCSPSTIDQAISSLSRIYSSFVRAQSRLSQSKNKKPYEKFKKILEVSEQKIQEAFNDDFSTPKAFASFFFVINSFTSLLDYEKLSKEEQAWCSQELLLFFKKYGEILSLFEEPAEQFLQNLDDYFLKQKNITRKQVDEVIQKRQQARDKKDFKSSDELRKQLTEWGIEVRDTNQGSFWEVKKHSFE